MRHFIGGASRNTDDTKADPEGCFHPLVLREVSEYMKKHSFLPDGTRRPADNWQHGMPRAVWRKSLERHWLDVRLHDKGFSDKAHESLIDALCAVIFNAQGRLLEELLGRDLPVDPPKHKKLSKEPPPKQIPKPKTWHEYEKIFCNKPVALILNKDGTFDIPTNFPLTSLVNTRYPVSLKRKRS
jgi:hypothetical protein